MDVLLCCGDFQVDPPLQKRKTQGIELIPFGSRPFATRTTLRHSPYQPNTENLGLFTSITRVPR